MGTAKAISANKPEVGPLGAKVLEWVAEMKHLTERGKQPDFSDADWAPFERLAAVDEFERIGCFGESQTFQQMKDYLTPWARHGVHRSTFRRMTERADAVLLELDEFNDSGDGGSVIRSVSIYGFNLAGKINHIDIYVSGEIFRPK
jgi:hypothetical protein